MPVLYVATAPLRRDMQQLLRRYRNEPYLFTGFTFYAFSICCFGLLRWCWQCWSYGWSVEFWPWPTGFQTTPTTGHTTRELTRRRTYWKPHPGYNCPSHVSFALHTIADVKWRHWLHNTLSPMLEVRLQCEQKLGSHKDYYAKVIRRPRMSTGIISHTTVCRHTLVCAASTYRVAQKVSHYQSINKLC